jgi:hypothetical protein
MNFNGDLRIIGHHIAEKYLNYSGAWALFFNLNDLG